MWVCDYGRGKTRSIPLFRYLGLYHTTCIVSWLQGVHQQISAWTHILHSWFGLTVDRTPHWREGTDVGICNIVFQHVCMCSQCRENIFSCFSTHIKRHGEKEGERGWIQIVWNYARINSDSSFFLFLFYIRTRHLGSVFLFFTFFIIFTLTFHHITTNSHWIGWLFLSPENELTIFTLTNEKTEVKRRSEKKNR